MTKKPEAPEPMRELSEESTIPVQMYRRREFMVHDLLTNEGIEKISRMEDTPDVTIESSGKGYAVSVQMPALLDWIYEDCFRKRDFSRVEDLLKLADRAPQGKQEEIKITFLRHNPYYTGDFSNENIERMIELAEAGYCLARDMMIGYWLYDTERTPQLSEEKILPWLRDTVSDQFELSWKTSSNIFWGIKMLRLKKVVFEERSQSEQGGDDVWFYDLPDVITPPSEFSLSGIPGSTALDVNFHETTDEGLKRLLSAVLEKMNQYYRGDIKVVKKRATVEPEKHEMVRVGPNLCAFVSVGFQREDQISINLTTPVGHIAHLEYSINPAGDHVFVGEFLERLKEIRDLPDDLLEQEVKRFNAFAGDQAR